MNSVVRKFCATKMSPIRKPRKDQVLVRVKACALNHLDLWVRKGLPGVKLPHILGSDIAGEIVEVGEYVTGFKPGQRVLLAPMHFCNHCAKCVAGLQNQCREFTVLGNARRWRQLRTDRRACRECHSDSRLAWTSTRPPACRWCSSPRGTCWSVAPAFVPGRQCWYWEPAPAWASPPSRSRNYFMLA